MQASDICGVEKYEKISLKNFGKNWKGRAVLRSMDTEVSNFQKRLYIYGSFQKLVIIAKINVWNWDFSAIFICSWLGWPIYESVIQNSKFNGPCNSKKSGLFILQIFRSEMSLPIFFSSKKLRVFNIFCFSKKHHYFKSLKTSKDCYFLLSGHRNVAFFTCFQRLKCSF